MRVLIHVGMNKTASTTLQREVFPLLTDVKVAGSPVSCLSQDIAEAMNQISPRLGERRSVLYQPGYLRGSLERIDDGRTLLISEEGYSSTLRHHDWDELEVTVDRLACELPEARILIVTRDPARLLVSSYSQLVRMGGTVTWHQFLSSVDRRLFDGDAVTALYRRRFGQVTRLRFEQLSDPASFARELTEILATSFPEQRMAVALMKNHNSASSSLLSGIEMVLNRTIRRSSRNPHPPLGAFNRLHSPLRRALSHIDRIAGAPTWKVSRRIRERRLAEARRMVSSS